MKFNKLIPELYVFDFEKSIKFYVDILDFKIEYSRGDKKDENKFALISMQGSQLMIEEITNKEKNKFITSNLEYPLGRGVNFQIEVDDVELIISKIKKKNYTLHMELKENWYRQNNKLLGNKEFMVLDPNGYLLRFSEEIGSKDL